MSSTPRRNREEEGEELHDLEAGTSSSSDTEEEGIISPSYNEQKLKGKKNDEEPEGGEVGSEDEVDASSSSGSLRDSAMARSDADLRGPSKATIPVTLAFKNLFFSVKVRKGKNPFQKKHKKTLLKDLHGELRPGEVTAIMGPSGAGKTTLLNLLAGRVQSGKTKGSLTVNDIPKSHISNRKWSRLSSYVMQDDVMFPMLTPRETFWFSAQLKLPFTERNKKAKVDALIEELGLEKCQKTKIGNAEHRGISGGQRKRVSIGMEMITDPSILFLDEPTSGLDSSTSYSLVEKLQQLASMGRTIVTTIHQPSTDIFFKFDRLMLLADGHMVYNGPTKDVVSYFAKLGYKCPKYTNPAEFIMNLVKADSYISSKEDGEARLKHLISAYRETHSLPELTEDGGDYADGIKRSGGEPMTRRSTLAGSILRRRRNQSDENDIQKLEVTSGPNFLYRWGLLLIRGGMMQARDPMQIPARVSQALFLAFLVGFLYLQLGDDQRSINDREGSLFFVTMSMAMGPMMGCLVAFQAERVVFIREHSTGSYSTLTYYLAKVLADLPFLTLVPIVQGTITYWMVGYQAEADKYFIFIAACIVITIVAHALGLAISAGAPDMNVSMAMAPMIFIPLMLLGGFFLNDDSIPKWLIWAKYFSPFKYGFQILARNELEGLTFTCTSNENCTPTGEAALEDLHLNNDEGSLWASFLFLFMQYFFFHTLAYTFLRLTAGRKKA